MNITPTSRHLAQRAIAFMEAHLTEKLTLERIVCALGTNRTGLNAAMRSFTGRSTLQYFTLLRLRRAEEMLLSGDGSVLEIAHLCGFEDENYFIRAFKKHYLQTPLQYRIAKKDAPLPPDPKREPLTVAAFEEYMKKGLGKAVLLLRQQPDKSPYKEAFLAHVKDAPSVLGIYERDLLDCFEDRQALRLQIRRIVFEQLEREDGRGCTAIPFLNLIGYREEVTALIEGQYADAKRELLEILQARWADMPEQERQSLSASDRFVNAQRTLGRFVRPGQQRIKELITDIADLFDYCENPPVPCLQSPFFHMWEGMGKEAFFEVYEEVCRDHKNGRKLLASDPVFLCKQATKPFEIIPFTADEIVERLRTVFQQNQWTPSFIKSFHACPDKTKKEVAERILLEDPETQTAFLYLYTDEMLESPPPVCPIPPEKLVALAKKAFADEQERMAKGEKRRHLSRVAHRVLRQMRHPAVREHALMLLEEQKDLREGLLLLVTKNYQPADYDVLQRALLALLRQNLPEHLRGLGPYALALLAEQGAPAPYPLLVDFFYDHGPFADRHQVTRLLLKTDMMTEQLRQECLFDFYPATRELVTTGLDKSTPIPPRGHIWERL